MYSGVTNRQTGDGRLTNGNEGQTNEEGQDVGPTWLVILAVSPSKHVNSRENAIFAYSLRSKGRVLLKGSSGEMELMRGEFSPGRP